MSTSWDCRISFDSCTFSYCHIKTHGSLSQAGEVDVSWLDDRTTSCGAHCGLIPQESANHCWHKGGEDGDMRPQWHGWQGKGEVKVR